MSRPILLFYAISQAGRAIVAAHGDQPEASGHGLREDTGTTVGEILTFQLKRAATKRDLFGAVVRATNCSDIKGTVPLGAIWATIPSTHRLPSDAWRDDWVTALSLREEASRNGTVQVRLVSMSGPPQQDGVAGVKKRMLAYPGLPPHAVHKIRWVEGFSELGNWVVDTSWPIRGKCDTLDAVAPRVDLSGARWLIPLLPGQSQPLNPLMSWWLLLFGLSMVARYHPALWTRSLSVDASTRAVPLEVVLGQAIERIPELIYLALLD